MSNWAPKPLRPMGVNGIFNYENEGEIKIEKSNRWMQQRRSDGSPYTRSGPSALTPPLAGPKLVLNDLEKALTAENAKPESIAAPELIVKSYLQICAELMEKGISVGSVGKRAANAAVSTVGEVSRMAGGATGKALDDDEEEADDLEKKCGPKHKD